MIKMLLFEENSGVNLNYKNDRKSDKNISLRALRLTG